MIFDGDPLEQPAGETAGSSPALPPARSASGLPPRPAMADPAQLELTAEMLAAHRGINVRNARAALRSCHLVRKVSTGGRPVQVYWVGDNDKLSAVARAIAGTAAPAGPAPLELWEGSPEVPPDRRTVDALDLQIARLRSEAVRSYLYMIESGRSEHEAAILTCGEWQTPKLARAKVTERIAGNLTRRVNREESVGQFSPRTLREWARIWRESKHDLRALAPQRRDTCGREPVAIPDALLDLVHATHCSTPRANLKDSLLRVRELWKGEWPRDRHGREPSYDTWRRRMQARWPERYCEALGKGGVAKFRAECSPDVTWDYNAVPFNFEYQLDDVQQDFYGHASDPRRLVRPFVYAVIRVATRQWVCAVACESRITQDQVRAMIGFALASRTGGIPDRIKFERGTVACDAYLEELLQTLGVKVLRTSMDGGRVSPEALPDVAKGHFQGKGVVESNLRGLHNANQFQPAQVGPDERHTAQARLESLKAHATKLAEAGEFLVLPTPAEWQALVFAALERHNNRPHSGLPEIMDPATGQVRHMTPNERARQLRADALRVMDETLLPLFFSKGHAVPVTRNGVRINSRFYGRFDSQLHALAGTMVTVYSDPDMADAVFCQELGRCLEAYCPAVYGGEGQIEDKRRIEAQKRNEYERLRASALESAGTFIGEALRFTANPTPDRAMSVLMPEALAARVAELDAGRNRLAEVRTERQRVEQHQGDYVERRLAKYETEPV